MQRRSKAKKIIRAPAQPNKEKKTEEIDPAKVFPFEKLPPDLQRHTSSFFKLAELKNIARVSKKFYRLAHGPHFWQPKFDTHFPGEWNNVRRSELINWKKEFSRDTHHCLYYNFSRKFRDLESRAYDPLIRSGTNTNLLQHARENNTQAILNIGVTTKDLCLSDKYGNTLCSLAADYGNQKLSDYYYKILYEHYLDIASNYFSEADFSQAMISARNINNLPLLHWAIICRQPIDDIRDFISAGHDAVSRSADMKTTLMTAVIHNHSSCLPLLLNSGVDVNAMDTDSHTAMHFAAKHNRQRDLQLLLLNGGLIDKATTQKERTPLHYAARFGNIQCAEILLKMGANINAVTKKGLTALIYAAKHGDFDMMKFLLERGADVNLADINGRSALLHAVNHGQHECVRLLLDHGANINQICTEDNCEPLTLCARDNHLKCLNVLIEYGANVNEVDDEEHYSALHTATHEGNHHCMQTLLEHGANPNTVDVNGNTPLCTAALNADEDSIALLLDYGANLNQAGTPAQLTPLLHAVSFGRNECVKLLLERGADIDAAMTKNKQDLINLLPEYDLHGRARAKTILESYDGDTLQVTPELIADLLEHRKVAETLRSFRKAKANEVERIRRSGI